MAKGINQQFKQAIFDVEPTALLELYTLYYDYQNDSQAQINFHGGMNGVDDKIIFDGQEYLPIPVETEGFDLLGDQRLPRPKLRVSNAGMYISSLLRKYNNLNNAKLVRKRTYAKFIDDVNFPNNENPWGTANPNAKMPDDKYFISRKTTENKVLVEFELVTSLELENIDIPGRRIAARYCPWIYRGYGCRYGYKSTTDRPIANIDDNLFVTGSATKWNLNEEALGAGVKFTSDKSTVSSCFNSRGIWKSTAGTYNKGDYVFTISERALAGQGLTANYYQQHPVFYLCISDHTASNDNHPQKAPTKWKKDVCSKKLGACKFRFANDDWSTDALNAGQALPYGGFPGTEKYGY